MTIGTLTVALRRRDNVNISAQEWYGLDIHRWMDMVSRNPARAVALSLVIGTVIGNLIPELCNLAAKALKLSDLHFFNGILALVALVGILVSGLALYLDI